MTPPSRPDAAVAFPPPDASDGVPPSSVCDGGSRPAARRSPQEATGRVELVSASRVWDGAPAAWHTLFQAALPRGGGHLSILEVRPGGPQAPERLPHDDRSFDVVCGVNVLSRSDDPAAAAAEITRVARQRIVLLEGNGLSAACRVAVLTGARDCRAAHLPWRVLRWFSRRDFDWIGVRPVTEWRGAGTPGRRLRVGVGWQSLWMAIVGQRRAAWQALRPVPGASADRAARRAS